ncbi:MAG: tail-specific protease, partial [Rheinheimera sp.]|nr:tail-specific protease [Rheinheimera sp.]
MKKLSVLAAAFVAAFSVNASPDVKNQVLVLPTISQDAQHATASKRITALFTRGHYTPVQLDDELSSKMFDTYLKNLDYYRNVLTKSDVAAFEQYRDKFDDGINKGNMSFAFDMFNLALKRRSERFDYALQLLDKG